MSRLSFEKRRAQQPAAHPSTVHVRVSGEGGASVGGTVLVAAPGEDIQQTVLNHLQRLAISLGAPIRATIHDDRAGCVVPLEVFADGSSRMAGAPVRVAPGASTEGTGTAASGVTQGPTGHFGPPPAMTADAPRATTGPEPAPEADARPDTPVTSAGSRPVAATDSWPEPAADSRRAAGAAPEPAPAAVSRPRPDAGSRPDADSRPAAGSRPVAATGSWPEPAADARRVAGAAPEPAPAAVSRPRPDAGSRPDADSRSAAGSRSEVDSRSAAGSRSEADSRSDAGSRLVAATGSWPEPAADARPAPAAVSWPEPAADSRPAPATDPRPAPAAPRPAPELRRVPVAAPVPAPLLDPAPVPAGSATPTPARGFDAVAEEVLGDEPVTETAEGAELLTGPLARINEAVRDGRIEAAAELADRTVTEASGVLGPHHPEVLHLGELTAYIAYLAGDPVRSFRRCLDLARLRRRAGDAEAAYGNVQSAATAWRAVRDPQEGLRLGRELIELWTELEAEPGPAAEDPDPLRSARARMVRLTDRAARAERA
ncbi:hypothetical protein [Streptomyces collinus]|uniref:hypothetical protein n=1 Tax=Streptomyces collinus TaxID=42684 RepID=UPI0036B61D1D